jgi:hypothetical protein
LARALSINPNHRAALLNRAYLALNQAVGRTELPPASAFQDVELALAGQPDPYVSLFAAHFYAWAAHQPTNAKVAWHSNPQEMRERCRTNLRKAVEGGVPDYLWKHESGFRHLFGDPTLMAKDWARPSNDAPPWDLSRTGNPLVEFGG